MSHLKAKMHQIRFRLGLRPRPHWGAHNVPQTPYLDFWGLLLREGGEGGKRRGGQWRGGSVGEELRRGKGRERTTLRTPCRKFLATALYKDKLISRRQQFKSTYGDLL